MESEPIINVNTYTKKRTSYCLPIPVHLHMFTQMSLNYIYSKPSPHLALGPSIFYATGLDFCF